MIGKLAIGNDLHKIIENSKSDIKFQTFYEIIVHAETCPKCSQFYKKVLNLSKMHLDSLMQ